MILSSGLEPKRMGWLLPYNDAETLCVRIRRRPPCLEVYRRPAFR